ncbi:hypothetical protein [Gemmatimonas sp.]|uniref:hypothetical protein n=1 Tax=Gemmatimonas sp. TaxID=1962908 RepID=UPI003DA356B8
MSIEEVRTLVAERQRYDDWLTALEAKRADTPPRVYERVHGDYLGRRSEVIARLQAHVGTLSTLGSELEDRLGDLQARLAAHEEELAEGMLRNLVGEYDADRWESVRQDVEHKIQALGHERAALASEVEDVQTLLASARTLPVPEEVAVAEVVEEPAPVVAEPVVPSIMPADELEDTAEIAVPLAFASDEVVEDVATEIVAETIAVEAEQGDSLLDFDVSGIVENPTPQGARHEDVLADVAALFDTSSITAVPEPTAPTGAAPMDHAEFDDALALFGESTNEADAAFLRSLDGNRRRARCAAPQRCTGRQHDRDGDTAGRPKPRRAVRRSRVPPLGDRPRGPRHRAAAARGGARRLCVACDHQRTAEDAPLHGMWYHEPAHGVVLRTVWRRVGGVLTRPTT